MVGRCGWWWLSNSVLPEEVAVDALHGIGALGGDPEIVVDHQLGEFLAVDQHDLGLVARGVVAGSFVKDKVVGKVSTFMSWSYGHDPSLLPCS